MSATLLLAGALLSQAAATPATLHVEMPAVSAAHRTAADDQTIIATARVHRYGWLATSGPDQAGQYRVWVNVSDLDLATEAGSSTMSARMQRATTTLCDISAEQPQVAGFYNRGQRECWQQTQDQASRQMQSAREQARQGKPVATLGMINN